MCLFCEKVVFSKKVWYITQNNNNQNGGGWNVTNKKYFKTI